MTKPQDRRDKRNIGGALGIDRSTPSIGAAHVNIGNIERLLYALFRSEIERFKAEPDELRRYFKHTFEPLLGEREREEFVKNFLRETPSVVLGYARTSTTFPAFAVILEEEHEVQNYVGDFVGHHDEEIDDEKPYSYYNGAMWESNYAIYVYAQHPDVCLYLYHFAKMLLVAGTEWLITNGVPEIMLSGAELAPDEQYLPDNMFARVLRVKATAVQTVPYVATVDVRRLRMVGLYRDDVVVDGIQGGVSTPEGLHGEEER